MTMQEMTQGSSAVAQAQEFVQGEREFPADTIFGDFADDCDVKPEGFLVIINVPDENMAIAIVRDLLIRKNGLEIYDIRSQDEVRAKQIQEARAKDLESAGSSLPPGTITGIKCFGEEFRRGVPGVDMTPVLGELEERGLFLDDVYGFKREHDGKCSVRFSFKERPEGVAKYDEAQLKRCWNYLARTVPYLYPHDNRASQAAGRTICLDGTHQYASNKSANHELHFARSDSFQFAIVPKADRRNR